MSSRWPLVPLGQVIRQRKEFIEIDDLSTYKRCRVQVNRQGIVLRDTVPGSEIKTKRQQVCHAGEFLVAEIDAKVGGYGIVPKELEGAVVSSHYFLFQVEEGKLDRRFLGWYARTKQFHDQVAAQGSTNHAAIRPEHVLGYHIPLPPLPDQRGIVGWLDSANGKLEELEKEQQAVERLVHSLASRASDVQRGREDESTYRRIEELCEIRGGIQKGPHRMAMVNPVRYLTVAHVHRDQISTADPRFFEVSPDELKRWELRSGDVLIIEGNGSADQIGRTALFRGEISPCVHQNHVIRLRPDRALVEPAFLNLYLNSRAGQEQIQALGRTAVGLRSLSVGRIRQIRVPVPPIRDQQAVIGRVAALKERIDSLKEFVDETCRETTVLGTSLLRRVIQA